MKKLTVSIQITVLFLNIWNETVFLESIYSFRIKGKHRFIAHKLKVLRVAQNKYFGGNFLKKVSKYKWQLLANKPIEVIAQ